MLDSSPIVCITGQVASKLIGYDAFQEVDITGITLPITKHNYLVTRAEDLAGTIREAFALAKQGRPGPVLIDLTKDAQQASCDFNWEAAEPSRHKRSSVIHQCTHSRHQEAIDLINHACRPLILAAHGVMLPCRKCKCSQNKQRFR